jgi:hypothetical protein
MRMHPWLAIPLFGLLLAPGAGARQWVESPTTMPACENLSDTELGCAMTACSGYGTAAEWADEMQVRFRMPHADRGGPWLIEYVAIFMSGTAEHQLIVRDPGSPPGAVLYDGLRFTPASATWPPSGWTYVELHASPPYPGYIVADENAPFMVGTQLLPGDAVGLAAASDGADGWSSYQGVWEDDTANASLTPTIRIGMTDLGVSGTDISTWSSVKALFR